MSYTIFPTDGDTITEAAWTAILDRANARDYVERGLGVTLNGNGTFDVAAGLAFVRDAGTNQTYPVEDESGTTGVQLADTSTTNYIYLTFDPSASDIEGSVEYHVDTDQTPPAGQPSLLIAEADESTSTVTPKNPEPSLSADEASIGSVTADQESITTDIIRCYGAGSGHYTDYLISDFADIGAAILQASDDGASTIVLPQGTHSFSTTIERVSVDRSTLRLIGQGADASSDPQQTNLKFTGNGQAFSFGSSNNLFLESLKMTGPGSQSGVNGIDYANTLRISKCVIEDFQTSINSTNTSSTNYTRIKNTTVRSSDIGIGFGGNSLLINGCRLSGAATANLTIRDCNAALLISTTIETSSSTGIFASTDYYGSQNPRNLNIIGNYFESNDGGAIDLGGPSAGPMRCPVVAYNYFNTSANASEAVSLGDYIDGPLVAYNRDNGSATNSITIGPNVVEAETRGEIHLTNGVSDSGTRTLRDGVGENAGDPTSTGQWSGNGREGVTVVDTSNATKYIYRGGAWV